MIIKIDRLCYLNHNMFAWVQFCSISGKYKHVIVNCLSNWIQSLFSSIQLNSTISFKCVNYMHPIPNSCWRWKKFLKLEDWYSSNVQLKFKNSNLRYNFFLINLHYIIRHLISQSMVIVKEPNQCNENQ
jgi:hypothetical protein